MSNPAIHKNQLKLWRESLHAAFATHAADYLVNPRADRLFKRNTQSMDKLMRELWLAHDMPSHLTLIAVGGYGRGEMYPYSDVDLLILLPENTSETQRACVELFLGTLWDIGLHLGHSVRTSQQCIDESALDVTVMTNLLESRLIIGAKKTFEGLMHDLQNACQPQHFFNEKMREQQSRHAKFNDTAYNLEPNIKESPGGLRDLHMILWVAQSQCLGLDWNGLLNEGLINTKQLAQIKRNQNLLQHLRIRLHLLAKRREDRLLFDFQNTLAEQLNYVTDYKKRASEKLMQVYYQSARAVMIENEALLKLLQGRLNHIGTQNIIAIDEDFALSQGLLITKNTQLFEQKPETILRSFLLVQQHPEIRGFSAPLIRALQAAQPLINSRFRQQARHKAQFLQILSYTEGVHHSLRLMNRYGILGRYIPVFGRIIAQMQHDLFHVYTVDEHTLNVLGNLSRFAIPELRHEFPLCSQLFASFSQPHLLYLAAIFHDIAKGRGGDHSLLGTLDARRFCRQHGLSKTDSALVAWLVEAHLKLSTTAQKSDLSDPDVIEEFAQLVGSETRLIALYLLTVADIRGTSPNVWNAWKARLLESLFLQTRRVLQQSLNTKAQLVLRRQEVLQKLKSFNLSEASVLPLWNAFGKAYFSRFDSDEIAWQSRLLMPHIHSQEAIVRTRLSPKGDGIQVMIYSKDHQQIFARICSFFDSMQYNIVQAQIYTTTHGYALDNFVILEPETRQVSYTGLLKHIEHGLSNLLADKQALTAPIFGRVNRQVKHMPIQTQVIVHPLTHADSEASHQLDIITSDRPGLLAHISQTLLQHQIVLHNAKINTLGNRAEDSFLISGDCGQTLNEERLQALKNAMSML